jgi:membrane associated rhomboid family serine protease
MGIYDRDYYQPEPQGFTIRRPQTVVMTLIVINIGIWIIDSLLFRDQGPFLSGLAKYMAATPECLLQPWNWWRFLTYGFAHDSAPLHVLGNMFGLFMLGRDVEMRYGRNEFLAFYLVCVVVSGAAWAAVDLAVGVRDATVIGASGAVVGVVVLFAFNFPRRTLLLFFVLPVPAWFVGVLVVLMDLTGATGLREAEGNIAYSVHLAGAAFAALYYRFNWKITPLIGNWSFTLPKRRPKFRVINPDEEPPEPQDSRDDELSRRADEILDKINREGIESLTRSERRILEKASKQAQERRRGP